MKPTFDPVGKPALWRVPDGRAIFESEEDAELAKRDGWKRIEEFSEEEIRKMYRTTQYVSKGQKPNA